MMRVLLCALLATLATAAEYPPDFKGVDGVVYRSVGGVDLKLWVFGKKEPGKPKPAIVFFFGGGWNGGSPEQFEPQCRHFAERGMVAIAADYRVRSRHGVKAVECVRDAKAAIAWVRGHAGRLGVDPRRIAAAGGSAGGHLAASTGTLSGFGADERPNAMILFNPACTLAAIEGWEPAGFGTRLGPERLGAEPVALSPAHHVGPHTPPTLILHGREDATVPYASAEAFRRAMRRADRPCRLVGYEGAGHGFFNRGPAYDATLGEADRFLVGLGWLEKQE